MSRSRRWPTLALHAWLALCLLLAQGLGQGHRVAHLGYKLAAATVEQGTADGWGHALGTTDCQLFDQLAHADQADGSGANEILLALTATLSTGAAPASVDASPTSPRARGPPFLA